MIPQSHLDRLGKPEYEGQRKTVIAYIEIDDFVDSIFDFPKLNHWDYHVVNGEWYFIRQPTS